MGGSESIVAINQSETEQTFTVGELSFWNLGLHSTKFVGTMALKQGFEPLLLLGSVRCGTGSISYQ